MSLRRIDPLETYVVREVLCCGEGHCVGVRYTHWESGEVCILGQHDPGASNRDVHLYHRLVLVPLYRGTKEDPYSPANGEMWDYLCLPENENRACHFVIAPKGMTVGQRISPGERP